MGIFSRPRRDDPMITALHPGEIFVFGSNSAGITPAAQLVRQCETSVR